MKNDPMFMKYLQGEHQKIMIGEIEGIPVKIKMDSYFHDKCIVDLKAVANLDLIWNGKTHQKENFIDYYNYVLQATLYQEIVKQNTSKQLPFIIAVATKEKYSERALLNIQQEKMNEQLNRIKEYLPRIQAIKEGKIVPNFCRQMCLLQVISKSY